MEKTKAQLKNPNPLTVNINGLSGNGKCALKLSSNSLDLSRGRDPSSYGRGGVINGGSISGSVRVSDLSDPIVSIVLMLLRYFPLLFALYCDRRESVGNNITNERVELGLLILLSSEYK